MKVNNDLNLNPCYCGKIPYVFNKRLLHLGIQCQIRCDACGRRGPYGGNYDRVVQQWQAKTEAHWLKVSERDAALLLLKECIDRWMSVEIKVDEKEAVLDVLNELNPCASCRLITKRFRQQKQELESSNQQLITDRKKANKRVGVLWKENTQFKHQRNELYALLVMAEDMLDGIYHWRTDGGPVNLQTIRAGIIKAKKAIVKFG